MGKENEITINFNIKTHPQEGNLTTSYGALRNLLNEEDEVTEMNVDSDKWNIDLSKPLDIECQPSYDGSVNLIINDDKNAPKIINTRFSKLEDNRFKVVNRNQVNQTNLYEESNFDKDTRLFQNLSKIPRIDLYNISNNGQLMGGNYTFYIRFADEDYNKTDFVAESGQVSIFKGRFEKIYSISGTLQDERTDKSITLKISNIDRTYSKLYVYFTRETSDTNGVRLSKAGMFKEPFDIKDDVAYINLTGYEDVVDITTDDINIQYYTVSAAKTQAQVQNMLFMGNIQSDTVDIKDLQAISHYIKVECKQSEDSVGYVNPTDYTIQDDDYESQSEYYNPYNIYYRLGYWPEEIYRLGIVYILNDDSLTPVFALRGCKFENIGADNGAKDDGLLDDDKNLNYLQRNTYIDGGALANTYGVFKNPSAEVIGNSEVKPLYYKITLGPNVVGQLKKKKVKGYFIVRQKRIPTILCQGMSVGVDTVSYTPMLKSGGEWFSESFLNNSRILSEDFESRKITTKNTQCSGLLSLDACVVPSIQSILDGNEFSLKSNKGSGDLEKDTLNNRHWSLKEGTGGGNKTLASAIFVDSDTSLKYVNGYSYATKCGSAEDVSGYSYFARRDKDKTNWKLLRGLFTPFIGIGAKLEDNTIYNIMIPGYNENYTKDYFNIRANDNSPFYAISDRYELPEPEKEASIDIYRGDCYSNTVTFRMNRNFIDSEVPISNSIIDQETWRKHYEGEAYMVAGSDDDTPENYGDYSKINRADVNAVPLGMWVTFKCLSSYNLGLRAIDPMHEEEYALMGSPRSFYPVCDMTTNVSHKIEDSWLLNAGYSATVGLKRNFSAPNVPYQKDLFDNRIVFSKVQQNGGFENAYRTLEGLSYKDIDRQYGAIVKLLPFENNLLCIFEHGMGLIPVNDKALISTEGGQNVYMYGAGVLQDRVTLISPDYGSIWPESIVQTPIGIYGVDTYAKKIWRYNKSEGLKTISDMKIQQFLNNHIKLSEQDTSLIIGIKNVKTHYNNFKGDVMFTFYNDDKEEVWNLCFNERLDKWVTRYSWTPLCSENINNVFYSLDRNRVKTLGYIYNNQHCAAGIHNENPKWALRDGDYESKLSTIGYESFSPTYKYDIIKIETSYLNDSNEEQSVSITNSNEIAKLFYIEEFVIENTDIKGLRLKSKSYSDIKSYFNLSYIPLYYNITIKSTITIDSSTNSLTDIIGVIVDPTNPKDANVYDEEIKLKDKFLKNGFYVHGKAGIFNEINYDDSNETNEILPTYWYDRQEPFEFEFVVNDKIGLHKIFDNLVIISNNVQPEELEVEIEGDVYNFNKAGIYREEKFGEDVLKKTKPSKPGSKSEHYATQKLQNCRVDWDTTLNSYTLVTNQECKNIEEYGRRLGNIQYKEDSWYITLEPIKYTEAYSDDKTTISDYGRQKEAKLRDKFAKIRVKYKGDSLVIITALKTLYTVSYA
jgi:hypothetical protein